MWVHSSQVVIEELTVRCSGSSVDGEKGVSDFPA